ncbi:hypothetical protein BC830DRAFT_1166598 [Chytriomyces sp. MP71]|nr:hypothetical protein BC830DRAFT_1166598 [Chytriomyces sp. MP71]
MRRVGVRREAGVTTRGWVAVSATASPAGADQFGPVLRPRLQRRSKLGPTQMSSRETADDVLVRDDDDNDLDTVGRCWAGLVDPRLPPTHPNQPGALEGNPASGPKALSSPHFSAGSPLAAFTSAAANHNATPPTTGRRQPSKDRIVVLSRQHRKHPISAHRRTSGKGSTLSRTGSLRRITCASLVNGPPPAMHPLAQTPRDLSPDAVIAAVVGEPNGDMVKNYVECQGGVSLDTLAGKCAPLEVGPEVTEWVVELGGGMGSLGDG